MFLAKLLWLFLLFIVDSQSANILGIVQIPSYSHQLFCQTLMKELAARGHHLTIISTHIFDFNNQNVTQIHLNESEKIYKGIINQLELKRSSLLKRALNELRAYSSWMKYHLAHPEVRELVTRSEKYQFDLVLIEAYDIWPTMAFAEIYDCPIIVMAIIYMPSTFLELLGNDVNPAIHSEELIFPYLHGKLTLKERLLSTTLYVFTFVSRLVNKCFNELMIREFFPQHSIA